MRPAAAPLIMRMRICLGGMAMVCNYLHPAVFSKLVVLNLFVHLVCIMIIIIIIIIIVYFSLARII